MEAFIGSGEQLSIFHMSIRALFMFFVALLLIRLGGLRIAGKKSGFDLVIVIMMGAILARGIVGASPFLATIGAAAVMIAINRILACASTSNKNLNQFFKGEALLLYDAGKIQWKNMNKASLSKSDLMTSLRLEMQTEVLDHIEKAYLETNGRISFIPIAPQESQ